MKRSIAALMLAAALGFAGLGFTGLGLTRPWVGDAALAQEKLDKIVKVGSLGDQSGLYQDIGGPGSSVAARMAIEDFGSAKVLGKPIRARLRRPPEQAGHRRQQGPRVVRPGQGRRHPGRRRVGHRAGGGRSREAEKPHRGIQRPGLGPCGSPTRPVLLAGHRALHLRHLRARERHGQGAGEGGRRYLVLPHRRLRLRPFAGKDTAEW